MVQQMRLMREAQSDSARLQIADKARDEGNYLAACRIYLRLAARRPTNPSAEAAEKRLKELGQLGRKELANVEQRLSHWRAKSPGDSLADESLAELAKCVTDLEELADQFGSVPGVGREIKTAATKHRNHPLTQAALNEPDAKQLWEEGQSLEQQGHICCAYLVFEEAAKKRPAPSAIAAQQRLEELKADPRNVEAAEACRNLQWCHQQYQVAERLAQAAPDRAKELFAKIIERSPVDSRIHAEARTQIARLQ